MIMTTKKILLQPKLLFHLLSKKMVPKRKFGTSCITNYDCYDSTVRPFKRSKYDDTHHFGSCENNCDKTSNDQKNMEKVSASDSFQEIIKYLSIFILGLFDEIANVSVSKDVLQKLTRGVRQYKELLMKTQKDLLKQRLKVERLHHAIEDFCSNLSDTDDTKNNFNASISGGDDMIKKLLQQVNQETSDQAINQFSYDMHKAWSEMIQTFAILRSEIKTSLLSSSSFLRGGVSLYRSFGSRLNIFVKANREQSSTDKLIQALERAVPFIHNMKVVLGHIKMYESAGQIAKQINEIKMCENTIRKELSEYTNKIYKPLTEVICRRYK